MTGQTLLDTMELLNQELQLQSGEVDVTRGLLALNIAQDYFETLAAARGKIFGSSIGTVVTANGVESTAFPSGLLRLDRMQLLDAATSLPTFELMPLRRVGGQAGAATWPLNILSPTAQGAPRAYWTNGTSIFWSPRPSGVYTVRWYGFQAAVDITAGGTFGYPDIVRLPLASFATRLMKSGVDDAAQDVAGLAQESFKGVLNTLEDFNRDGPLSFEYSEVHNA